LREKVLIPKGHLTAYSLPNLYLYVGYLARGVTFTADALLGTPHAMTLLENGREVGTVYHVFQQEELLVIVTSL